MTLIVILIIFGILVVFKNFFKSEITYQDMEITSNAFSNNGKIPPKYTCDGDNVNPYLKITNIPEQTKSLVLIVDDPDAPSKTWVNWIVFNISVSGKELIIPENSVPKGIQGINDFKKIEDGGPCPPSGTHRYSFKIYALDSQLELKEGSSKKQVEEVMKNHIIDNSELVGVYSKK